MPKKTFLNLPNERQRKIVEVSFREFILNDYQTASLSRIVKDLGLAKGSFYRYFDSKKDLYLYLLELATAGRYEALNKRLQEPGMTLMKLIALNWQDKLEFEIDHPLESAFQYRVYRERYNPDLGDMEIRLKREITQMTNQIITRYFPQEVNQDLEPELLAFHIMQVQMSIYDFLAIRFGDDLLENIKAGRELYSMHKEEFQKLIRSFTLLLAEGILHKNQLK